MNAVLVVLCFPSVFGIRSAREIKADDSTHKLKEFSNDIINFDENFENPFSLPEVPVGWDGKDYKLNFRGNTLGFKLRRAPIPKAGFPWPKPQRYFSDSNKLYRLQKGKLDIKIPSSSCNTLHEAISRYKKYIFTCTNDRFRNNLRNIFDRDLRKKLLRSTENSFSLKMITSFVFDIKQCTYLPSLSADESYKLTVNEHGISIVAGDVWGALRGLETLSHITVCSHNKVILKDTEIEDFPRFPHRGIMVDTARHFMSKETLFQIMRGMEMNKMNVMHWHLSDDQSFPFQSKVFPELSVKGAFHPSLVYTHDDVREIIEFGRLRGIRVIPEFDTPAHTLSWSFSKPELLTQCYHQGQPVPALMGPMNPARNSTYLFLREFYKEVLGLFQDQFVHVGGDEVPFECWNSNTEVVSFAKEMARFSKENHVGKMFNGNNQDMIRILDYFTKRLIADIKDTAKQKNNDVRFIVWEEAYTKKLSISENTVVQLWYGGQDSVSSITADGFSVIYSSCWYLDQVIPGIQWQKFYTCDPVSQRNMEGTFKKIVFSFSLEQNLKEICLRFYGEVCIWSEHITNEDVLVKLWPIASAAAERLWSAPSVTNVEEAAPRLEEQRCRMLRRGIPVGSSSGPGFCIVQEHSPQDFSFGTYTKNNFIVHSKRRYKHLPGISFVISILGILACVYVSKRTFLYKIVGLLRGRRGK
ncbi:beta-hexosaminidase subunit beta-like [Saccostrea echinata]|uniref:beta-hexosaminidase subunit beta-like n=1 Tax=Saccostrea echinata TaxID=191078 RepID=UPI002A82EAE6|nr:beta-hexosaminidase subunit beta-like [Saccostrea echinata]